ncbi:MAG: hypothetical protein IT307_06980 [Chloroflexi bacterium]|nr:hypothetical protein [Chloroflexota bacterium]
MHVAWTGQRPELFAAPEIVVAAIGALVIELTPASGVLPVCLCGGQRGVDLWAAEAALRAGWPLALYLPLPLKAFSADWDGPWAGRLATAAALASETRVFATEGLSGYSRRNRALATRADLLVAVLTGAEGGGTAETIAAAQAMGVPIRRLAFTRSAWIPPAGARGL